jgi:hypothetical protein
MSSNQRRYLAALGAVVTGAVVAVAAPGGAAVADLSSPEVFQLQVAPTAVLQAKGAAVSVPVRYTCPAGRFAFLDLSLTQRSGSEAVSGTRTQQVQCTGSEQTLVVNVLAQTGSRTFKTGPAFVEATLNACGYMCGAFVTDSRTVSVRK